MRILHIGKYYAPYTGGMESVVKDLCEGQAQAGHHVDVLCYNDKKYSEIDSINGVGVYRMGTLGVVAGQPISLSLAFQLPKMAPQYDIVHVHSPNPVAEALCLLLPKNIPLIVTHHSDIVRQKFLVNFYYPIYRKFLNRVRKIHVPTENHITFSPNILTQQNKCEVIPFGIREDHLHKTDIADEIIDMRNTYGRYALFVGRLVGYKGVDVLIEAASRTHYPVVIVGDGPLREELEAKVAQENLGERVHILGKVMDDKKFRALYHACHFLVLPSVTPNENFGMTQLEAMACGKPVVTTNLKSGVPAVGVIGKTTLITEPGDVKQLAGSMTMLMENPELQVRMGRSAFEHFFKKYRWQDMIAKTLDSYERVACFNDIIDKYRDIQETKKSA